MTHSWRSGLGRVGEACDFVVLPLWKVMGGGGKKWEDGDEGR